MSKRDDFYEERFSFEQSLKSKRDVDDSGTSPKLQKILDAFNAGKIILDVGCHNGFILNSISGKLHAEKAYGLDISDEAVEAASKYKNLKISKCDFDEDDLPFEDGYFDACMCGDVIEHLFDPDHLIVEIRRVIKTGGYAVFTTPNLASWYNRISLLLGWQPGWTEVSTKYIVGHPIRERRALYEKLQPSGHLRVFTTRALIGLLCKYRFKIERVEGYPFFTEGILGALDSIISRNCNLATFVLVKVRK